MAKVNRSEIINNAIEGARINTAVDKVPDVISPVITPVLEIGHIPSKVINDVQFTSRSNTGTSVITLSSTKRTFLIGYVFAASTSTTTCEVDLYLTPSYRSANIQIDKIRMCGITGTQAEIEDVSRVVMLPVPLELQKGSTFYLDITSGNAGTYSQLTAFFTEIGG